MTRRLVVLLLLLLLPAVAGSVPAAAGEEQRGCGMRGPASVVGTDGNDDLVGTEGVDVVWLGDGDDTFHGLGGDDVICGGPGADTVHGEAGNDELYPLGDPSAAVYRARLVEEVDRDPDVLDGGEGIDTLHLVGDALVVDVPSGTSTSAGLVDAFAGFEAYRIAGDETAFTGTDGPESLVVYGSARAVMGLGDDTVRVRVGDSLVEAGRGADEVRVESGEVDGGEGRDLVVGTGRVDVTGGDGRDEIVVTRSLAHVLDGGAGRDRVWLAVSRALDVDLRSGTGRYSGLEAVLTILGTERLTGGIRDDVLRGTRGTDRLGGGDGHDVLIGRGGDDWLVGGPTSRDRADGGVGADRCSAELRTSCEE